MYRQSGKGDANLAYRTGAPPSLFAPCSHEKLHILECLHLLVSHLGNHGVKQPLLLEGHLLWPLVTLQPLLCAQIPKAVIFHTCALA